MQRLGVIILLALSLAGCASERLPPPHIWEEGWISKFHEKRYGEYMAAMGEPSLSEIFKTNPEARIYRIFELPYSDHPLAITLIIDSQGLGNWRLVVLDGQAGYDIGDIKFEKEGRLDEEMVNEFLEYVEDMEFWNFETDLDRPLEIESETEPDLEVDINWIKICTQGTRYVMEAVDKGQHYLSLLGCSLIYMELDGALFEFTGFEWDVKF